MWCEGGYDKRNYAIAGDARMSAYGYKQTFGEVRQRVRFTPESGHSEAQEHFGLKKRTLDVRSTPDSGRKWLWRGMSASDPKRTSQLSCSRAVFLCVFLPSALANRSAGASSGAPGQ